MKNVQKNLWYPDESGKWMEVSHLELVEQPTDINPQCMVEVLLSEEREHMSFDTGGKNTVDYWDWDCRINNPIVAYKIIKEVKTKPETYTKQDIENAFSNLGWHEPDVDHLIQALKHVSDTEYKEYVRLKAKFETKE